jgi:chromosome segregation ATPase
MEIKRHNNRLQSVTPYYTMNPKFNRSDINGNYQVLPDNGLSGGNMEKEKANVNDVDNIRKILFGDQIAQMEERFGQLENSIAQLRTENRNLRQALEAELTEREKTVQELKNLLDATQQEWNKKRGENYSSQAELMSALQKALDLYKSKII